MRQAAIPFDIEQLAYLSDEAFIHHCFVLAHRHVCNPSRARHYLAALASGTSRGEVARGIFQEDEYAHQINTSALKKLLLLDGELFLHEAYRRILGRPIDDDGSRHYLQSLSKGEEKLQILNDIATSTEGQARRALHPELNDFVEFLTRENATQGPNRLIDIVRLMALKDDEFVQKAYRVLLRRDADAGGLAAYQAELRTGCSKVKILHSLAYSVEGRGFLKTVPFRLYMMFGRFI